MPPKKSAMTDDHKRALARGREQGSAVRDYLEWLEWSRPMRGRKRDTSPQRLAEVEAQIAVASSPLQRLQLVQLRHDLESASQEEDDPAEGERVRKAVREARAGVRASQGDQLRELPRARCARRRVEGGGHYASWRVIGLVERLFNG